MAERAVRRDPAFASGLIVEAVRALTANEPQLARNMIRHVIKGTIGYGALSAATGTPETSLVRMFGPRGNPTLAKLLAVLAALSEHAGITLEVTAKPLRAPRSKPGRPAAKRPGKRTAKAASGLRRAA